MAKKLALIINGKAGLEQKPLEDILREKKVLLDVFHLDDIQQIGDKFKIKKENDKFKTINPKNYKLVVRVIQGGVPGDSARSWELQKFFQEAGAASYISLDTAKKVTDKIECKKILLANQVKIFPSVTISNNEYDRNSVEDNIDKLGEPPYIIRKSLGSGKDSVAIATNMEEVFRAIEQYTNPQHEGAIASGVMIHKKPRTLNKHLIDKYELGEISDAEERSYHFRVIILDNNVFGVNICYSQPGKFGLNPAQEVSFKPVSSKALSNMPLIDVIDLAKNAANAHGLKLAAVDVVLDDQMTPAILDMNASPDLSLTDARGKELKHAVADSIKELKNEILKIERLTLKNNYSPYR